jgi:hypothetical protein
MTLRRFGLSLHGEPGGPTSITGTARSVLAILYIVITFLSRHTEFWSPHEDLRESGTLPTMRWPTDLGYDRRAP